MGQKTSIINDKNLNKKNLSNLELINKNSFELLSIIGKGGFGKVWKVYHKKSKKLYAMKLMSKQKIIDKKSAQSVKNERNFLSKIFHPFIINMHYAFQDSNNLYLVMDYLTGGDLRYHLCLYNEFNEIECKFFAACILLALEYIHDNNVIHRDLKPENLVFDKEGYLKLTDFGIAKIYNKKVDNSSETSGTPGYMAPEVLCCLNHNQCVDYYALGIILYEIMMKKRPYNGRSRRELKEKVLSKQVQINKKFIPNKWSFECADFINKLIQRKPKNRLGYNGINEIKEHIWLKFFNWKDLYLRKIDVPFIPPNDDNFDAYYCNKDKPPGIATLERYEKIDKTLYKTLFVDYYYYDRDMDQVINDKIHNENKILNDTESRVPTIENINEKVIDNKVKLKIKSRNQNIKNFRTKQSFRSLEDLNNLILQNDISKTNNGTLKNLQKTVMINPHLIYRVLEQKEKDGFGEKKNNNNIDKSHIMKNNIIEQALIFDKDNNKKILCKYNSQDNILKNLNNKNKNETYYKERYLKNNNKKQSINISQLNKKNDIKKINVKKKN